VSSLDLSAGRPGHVGFTPASAPNVRLIRPDRPSYLPPPMPSSRATAHSERAHALVVIVLTLACTALAIFDLFLLAAGA
jgi:hypothetical protein